MKAIKIRNAKDDLEFIRAEYSHISKKLGRKGIDWDIVDQHSFRQDGKMYDEIEVRVVSTGKIERFVFDSTELFRGLL